MNPGLAEHTEGRRETDSQNFFFSENTRYILLNEGLLGENDTLCTSAHLFKDEYSLGMTLQRKVAVSSYDNHEPVSCTVVSVTELIIFCCVSVLKLILLLHLVSWLYVWLIGQWEGC